MNNPLPAPRRFTVRETRIATVIAFFAWAVAVYDFIMFGTLLPVIKEDFGWSESQALFVHTLTTLGGAIVVFVLGPLVDRFGRRRGMMLTVAGTAVSSGLTALATNIAAMVGIRSISGLGLAEQSVNATYLNEVYELTEDEKARRNKGFFYSFVQSGWPVGALIASAFVSIVAGIFGANEWRLTFLLATIPGLLILWIRRSLRESPQFEATKEIRRLKEAGQAEQAELLARQFGIDTSVGAPLKAIFTGRRLRNTLVLGGAFFLNWFAVQSFSVLATTVLTSAKGLEFSVVTPLLVIANLVGAAGYLFFGWAGDRWGRRNLIGLGWIAASGLFAALLLIDMPVPMTVVIYSLGLFCLLGPAAALFFYIAECYDAACRATGGTFILAVSQPGAVLAGFLLSGLIAAGLDINISFTLVGVLGCLASGLLVFAAHSIKEPEAKHSLHHPHKPHSELENQ
ncbi:MFS transporter [Arthrobacter ginkgonis]|uniref:MFS transporter n=1 Tax=Arthrobacter ginkgonis TaxID=1630594 RepID=UPI0031E6749D